ncbi:hypothetical protein [Prosthecobacter sp.]|uniref:hypothetical protein n=1 Tax=Prosthecobacter sp. TaxID=1965333 RepID=UPI003783E52C
MKSLAEALSYSVAFLAAVERNDDDASDRDCEALECIAAIVREATQPEFEAIRAACETAIADLLKCDRPNHALIQGYRDCIENFCIPIE